MDPSLIDWHPRIRTLKTFHPTFCSRIYKSLINRTIFYLGNSVLEQFLKPNPTRFAKGLGLTLSSLASLFKKDSSIPLISKHANVIKNHLLSKRIPGTYLWAHEVEYEILGAQIDGKTPNLVTSSFVALGFLDWWKSSGDEEYLNIFNKIVRESVQIFPQLSNDSDGKCFMYTPNSKYFVHNANLLMAEILALSQRWLGTTDFTTQISDAIRYTLCDFNNVKHMPYAGPPTRNLSIDNYHTGYVIRSLATIAECLPQLATEFRLHAEIKKFLNFYMKNFIRDHLVYRDLRNNIESHSLAEAIILAKEFANVFSNEEKTVLHEAIRRTSTLLWHPKRQYFINMIKPLAFGFSIKDQSDQIRWSKSWLVYALSK